MKPALTLEQTRWTVAFPTSSARFAPDLYRIRYTFMTKV
jgi:hypothetical protein